MHVHSGVSAIKQEACRKRVVCHNTFDLQVKIKRFSCGGADASPCGKTTACFSAKMLKIGITRADNRARLWSILVKIQSFSGKRKKLQKCGKLSGRRSLPAGNVRGFCRRGYGMGTGGHVIFFVIALKAAVLPHAAASLAGVRQRLLRRELSRNLRKCRLFGAWRGAARSVCSFRCPALPGPQTNTQAACRRPEGRFHDGAKS